MRSNDWLTPRRVVVAACLGVGGLGLVGATLPGNPTFDSTTETVIRSLNRRLLWVAVPLAVLVEGVLLYTVFRFRAERGDDDPEPTPERRRLEIAWTLATAVVLLYVGVASYQALGHPDVAATHSHGTQTGHTHAGAPGSDGAAVEVEITARQWAWDVTYVSYLDENVSVEDASTIYLPADRPLLVRVRSADVIHSVHVPGLGLKQDAIPGQTTVLRTRITSPGSYRLYCAEYCGLGHSQMRATVRVVSPREYRAWLERQRERE